MAVAEAKRAKLDEEYAAELEVDKAEASKRKSQAKGKPRGEKTSERERIPAETTDNDRRTSTARAKAAGTNRKYLDMAEDILEKAPEKLEAVETPPRRQRGRDVATVTL